MQMSSAAFVFGQGAAGPVSTLTYSNIIKTAPCSVGSFAIGTTAQVFSERDFCLKGKERKPCLFICLRAYLSRSCLTTGQHAYKLCVCMYVCLSYTHLPENNSVSVQWIKIIHPENGQRAGKPIREAEQLQITHLQLVTFKPVTFLLANMYACAFWFFCYTCMISKAMPPSRLTWMMCAVEFLSSVPTKKLIRTFLPYLEVSCAIAVSAVQAAPGQMKGALSLIW